MKITKKYKIYGAAIVLGLGALVADQFIRGGDAAPAAGATSAVVASSPRIGIKAAAPSATASGQEHAPGESISQAFRTSAKNAAWPSAASSAARDPFAKTNDWTVSPLGGSQFVGANASARFAQSHRLMGVVTSAGQRHAMVDRNILGVGQKLDGFTLVSIESRSATFESGAERAVLEMDRASVQPPAPRRGDAPLSDAEIYRSSP